MRIAYIYTVGCQSLEQPRAPFSNPFRLKPDDVNDYSECCLFELGNDTIQIHNLCSRAAPITLMSNG